MPDETIKEKKKVTSNPTSRWVRTDLTNWNKKFWGVLKKRNVQITTAGSHTGNGNHAVRGNFVLQILFSQRNMATISATRNNYKNHYKSRSQSASVRQHSMKRAKGLLSTAAYSTSIPTAMATGQIILPFFAAHSQVILILTTASQSLPGYFHQGIDSFSSDHAELDATEFLFFYRSFLLAGAKDHFTRPTEESDCLLENWSKYSASDATWCPSFPSRTHTHPTHIPHTHTHTHTKMMHGFQNSHLKIRAQIQSKKLKQCF